MLKRVLTKRFVVSENYWDIVFEWEDVLSCALNIPVCRDFYSNTRLYQGLMHRVPNVLSRFRPSGSLVYVMNPQWDYAYNDAGVYPCIIDFYLRDKYELSKFYRRYEKCPIVLISSLEAYDYLKSLDCPLNIRHWGLGLADQWLQLPVPEKIYDLVIVGRVNPVLNDFLNRYIKEHPEFVCIRARREQGRFVCRDISGAVVGDCTTRVAYMEMIRKSRLALYSTPSIDLKETHANGFNQVTPRFLEFLSAGCWVISRFIDNSDTRYYELDKVSTRVQTYEQFVAAVKDGLSHLTDSNFVHSYLRQHTISARARELKRLIRGDG